MLKKIRAIFLVSILLFAGSSFATVDPTTGIDFPHPGRIRYDARSLIIDNKPVFIFSGAIHYFRCPKELWKDRVQKLKDAGLNCVETYLAWNLHEPVEPASPNDFSKLQNMQDIAEFIQTAQELGLYVIIRPGPYICAEWDRGGLPGWLMKHKSASVPEGQFLRGNSPEMLAWDRHWYSAAAKIVKPYLITNLPPGTPGVILWQLENEYNYNGAGLSSEIRTDVLRTLAHASVDNGINVPLFTCETTDKMFRDDPFLRSHVLDTVNRYPGFDMQGLIGAVEDRAKYQPEKFRAVTELQGGWFSQVGGKLADQQGLNTAQINQLTLTAIEHGVTSINYYMFYGGSNFGYGAALTMTQSYDYNAPLREWGGMGERYCAVKAIGQLLKEHGDQLIHSEAAPVTITGDHPDVSITLRRSKDGSQFIFFRNNKKDESRKGSVVIKTAGEVHEVSYDLGNFGAKIFYRPFNDLNPAHQEWLPRPAAGDFSAKHAVEAAVTVTSIQSEDPANNWIDLPDGASLIAANIFDQRYLYYRATFTLTADDLKTPLALRAYSKGGEGALTARINGKEITALTQPGSRANAVPLAGLVHEGQNTAEILFENQGCANGGVALEEQQGITQLSLVPNAPPQSVPDWRFKILDGEETKQTDRPEFQVSFDDHNWQKISVDAAPAVNTPNTTAIYRTALAVTKNQLAAGIAITFGTIDDAGILYVNGEKAGVANSWSHPWTFDITKHLHEGKNSVVLLVTNTAGVGGLYNSAYLESIGKPLTHLQVSPDTTVSNGSVDSPRRLLTRYTLEFTLPAVPVVPPFPWKLSLDMDANAFVSLNGHLLGRYWSVGPQHDFWLPVCWLNTAPNAKNTVTLQAHATLDALPRNILKSAVITPYNLSP